MAALQRPVMKQNMSSSDSFGSIDEEVLKELKNVPAVLATQDELDLVDVVKGLQDRLKVQPPTTSALPQEVIPAKQANLGKPQCRYVQSLLRWTLWAAPLRLPASLFREKCQISATG